MPLLKYHCYQFVVIQSHPVDTKAARKWLKCPKHSLQLQLHLCPSHLTTGMDLGVPKHLCVQYQPTWDCTRGRQRFRLALRERMSVTTLTEKLYNTFLNTAFYLKCQKKQCVHKTGGPGLQEVTQNVPEDEPTCLEENSLSTKARVTLSAFWTQVCG